MRAVVRATARAPLLQLLRPPQHRCHDVEDATDLFDISRLAHHRPGEPVHLHAPRSSAPFVLLFMIGRPLTAIMLVVT